MTMPTIVYDTDTRGILLTDPARDDDGNVIMPNGVDAATADISDAEFAKFATPDARFTLAEDGTVTVETVTPPVDPREQDWQAILTDPAFNSFGLAARQGFARLVNMPEPET